MACPSESNLAGKGLMQFQLAAGSALLAQAFLSHHCLSTGLRVKYLSSVMRTLDSYHFSPVSLRTCEARAHTVP